MARAAAFVLFAAGALIIDIPLSLIAGRPAHQPAAAVPTVEKACKQGHRFGIVRPACFGFQNPLTAASPPDVKIGTKNFSKKAKKNKPHKAFLTIL